MASVPPRQSTATRAVVSSTDGPPPWLVGERWADEGLRQPGWLLLPLRAFLAVTFIYASLQKFASPSYLDPNSPSSVLGQMQSLRASSPLGPLLGLSAHAPTLVGLTIALGELAVGVGTLIGLWTRLAAVGGALLALSFFLTVSWNTTPYYYGSDIVFFFAWLVIVAFGAGGVLSVDGWLCARARRELRLPPTPSSVVVAVPALRRLCERSSSCQLRPSGHCSRWDCPTLPVERPSPPRRAELDRRALLLGARVGALVAVVAGVGAALAAVLGRLGGSSSTQAHAGRLQGGRRHSGSASERSVNRHPAKSSPSTASAPPGTAIGKASVVPVGQAARFTDPSSGQPAWVVHPSSGTFVAFSAVCTHAGCTVQFSSSDLTFVCPCHGGTYNAKTGQVLAGPPPSPLPPIPVHDVNGELRVD
jgi:thiosulfate dehydrogenase [quinone] large subunit